MCLVITVSFLSLITWWLSLGLGKIVVAFYGYVL